MESKIWLPSPFVSAIVQAVAPTLRESAEHVRSLIEAGRMDPGSFRAALVAVPPLERDVWADQVLGLDAIPEDGPELPRGCAPYLPCRVDAVLRMVEQAAVQASDVVVDVGSGVGRAAALVHLLTGAGVIGIEIQPELVRAAHALTARLNLTRVSTVQGDATRLAGYINIASVFFLYCPFGGERLERVLEDLQAIARMRPVRIGCVDMAALERPWLKTVAAADDVAVYSVAGPGAYPEGALKAADRVGLR